jgi:cell division protein FtsN
MQINLDKKSGLLLGIIAGLLVVIVVLLVAKIHDEGNMVETHSGQFQLGMSN